MSLTPEFIGQVYTRTPQGDIWRANSLIPGDWTLDVQNAQFMWDDQTVNLFALAALTISGPLPGITSFTINIPIQGGGLEILNTSTLQSLSMPVTTSVDPDSNNTGTLKISNHSALASINLPIFVAVGWQLIITSLNVISTIALPSFTTCDGGLTIAACGSLASLSLPVWVPKNGRTHGFTGNALDAASVNGILARCVANAGFVSGTVRTDQGTSAAPTGQGIADAATLTGRGVTVITN